MEGGFAAFFTELLQFHFVGSIDLVFLGQIILAFANRAQECKDLALSFFGHEGNYTARMGSWRA